MPVEAAISDFTKEAQRNILDEWTVLSAGEVTIEAAADSFPSDANKAFKVWVSGK